MWDYNNELFRPIIHDNDQSNMTTFPNIEFLLKNKKKTLQQSSLGKYFYRTMQALSEKLFSHERVTERGGGLYARHAKSLSD